jgi:hypothetical protein
VGRFKDRRIQEQEDIQLELFFLQNAFHEQVEDGDSYSLFLPNYESEMGRLLPHEKPTVPAELVVESLKKIS